MPEPIEFSVIKADELTKPATVLIERISDAVGGIARPWQITRVACAEAKAEIIKAKAKIQISELEERALKRWTTEEGKRQENIEAITGKSIPLISNDAKPENIPEDWISHFFEKGRLIRDQDMQQIWASILAGEANSPGTFSKRTIEIVSTFSRKDAEIFTKFCSLIWNMGNLTPIVLDVNNPIPGDDEINFSSIQHLMHLGLIIHGLGYAQTHIGKNMQFAYYGKLVQLEFQNNQENQLQTGQVMLTEAGSQLAAVSGSTPNETYFMNLINRWTIEGLCPSEPIAYDRPTKRFETWFSMNQKQS